MLERGPARKARGHLELGVSTALTYGLQIPRGIEAALRGIEIAERLGDEALWAGATEAYGWHKIIAGDLQEGFDAQERAFVAADRGQRPFLAWMASNIRGQMTWGIGDPDAGQRFLERAGALPYAQNTARRAETADGIGRCHAARGEMDAARRLLSDARPAWVTHSLEPLIGLWSGDWDRVDALAARVIDTSRRNGNRWDEWASDHLAARVAYLRDDHARAAELLERALEIVAGGGADYFATWVLPDLARVRAEAGRVEEARAALEPCRAILDRGEDWRGRAGVVALADAVVLSAEDRPDDAAARFAAAHTTLTRFGLVGEQAECLHEWGRALARAGDTRAAAEKLGRALAAYRSAGAGAPWLERVAEPAPAGHAALDDVDDVLGAGARDADWRRRQRARLTRRSPRSGARDPGRRGDRRCRATASNAEPGMWPASHSRCSRTSRICSVGRRAPAGRRARRRSIRATGRFSWRQLVIPPCRKPARRRMPTATASAPAWRPSSSSRPTNTTSCSRSASQASREPKPADSIGIAHRAGDVRVVELLVGPHVDDQRPARALALHLLRRERAAARRRRSAAGRG